MAVTSPETSPQQPFTLAQMSGPPPRRRRTGLIVGLAAGAVVLAAIAGTAAVVLTGGHKPASTGATAAATPAAARTTAAPAATIQQYASAASPPIKSLRDSYASYQANLCAARSGSDATLVCTLAPLTLKTEAQTLSLVLRSASSPSAGTYIGPAPAEIGKLVTDTIKDADTLDGAVNSDGSAGPEFFLVITDLMNTIDRWDPYL
jgi:hypothetical protein